jgi:hypothetical protein
MGLCIGYFSLVPAMRALYALALISMTAKFLLHYRISVESGVGRRRMAASGGSSALTLTLGGWPAFTAALRHRPLRLCALMMVLMTCFNVIQANFWPLFIRSGYGVGDAALSAFPMVKGCRRDAVGLRIHHAYSVNCSVSRRPTAGGIGAHGVRPDGAPGFFPDGRRRVVGGVFSRRCANACLR